MRWMADGGGETDERGHRTETGRETILSLVVALSRSSCAPQRRGAPNAGRAGGAAGRQEEVPGTW